jgi:hypothetical protein
MGTIASKEDREFAVELLSSGTLTEEQEVALMDNIDAFDQGEPGQGPSQEELARNEAFAATSARIDRTPTVPPERPTRFGAGPLGFPAEQRPGFVEPSQAAPDRQILLENAAAAGVDVLTGLDARTRAAAGLLAFDGQAQVAAVDAMLRKDLQGVPEDFPVVFTDESTGELMFLRQTEDGMLKPTLLNPPGLDVGDVLEFAGEVPTLALETVGSIGGAIVGSAIAPGAGTVIGGTTGATLLAGLSVPAREAFARAMGVPKEIIDEVDTSGAALWQAGLAAGGELAAFAALGTVSGMRNFIGRPLDIEDVPALEAEIQKNLRKIKELEDRTGATFNPSIGELSGNADLLVAEANLKRDAIGRAARDLRIAEVQSDKASVEALESMATRTPRTPADEGFRSSEEVSGATRETLVENPVDALTQTRIDAEDALTDAQVVANRDADLDELTNLRNNVFAQADKIVKVEAKAWEQYRKAAGWDPQRRQSGALLDNRGNTPIRQVMQRLERDGNEALLASLGNAHKATLRNAGFPDRAVNQMVDPEDLSGLAQQALDPHHLHMALSHMKRELRAVQNGTNPNGWEASDLSDVIGALEAQMVSGNMISRATGRPLSASRGARVRDAWNHANDVTQQLHTTFDTKNMQSLMETQLVRTGERTVIEMPNMPAGLIRKRMLASGDARMLGEAMEVLGHDPRAKAAMVNELRKLHADTVIRDGRFQQGLHNEFMDNYSDHIKILDMDDNIQNVAQMGRAAEDAVKNVERIEGRLQQLYGRNVADPTKPLNIAEEILSNRVKPAQAHRIMKDLRRLDGNLANSVEETLLEEILQTVTGNKGKVVNAAQIQQILRSNRDTLTAVFGPRYVKDLDLLQDTLSIMGERGFARSSKVSLQSAFTSVTRSLFGPLSKKQRFLTSVQRVARNTRAGKVADILENPGALRQFVQLRNLTPRDPRYWVGIQGLGLLDEALFSPEMEDLYNRFNSGDLETAQRRFEERFSGQ